MVLLKNFLKKIIPKIIIVYLNDLKKKYKFKKSLKIKNFKIYSKLFYNKSGIEIGGPSPIFSKDVPIYQIIKNLDGCNFSNQTIWEGKIVSGNNYNYFKEKKGFQNICEASDLKNIESEKYDFLISSHCLEHCANAIKTLNEWSRVVKKNGLILLVLPNKEFTFDNNRLTTKFQHLMDDFNKNVTENDLTHLDEILNFHNLQRDLDAGSLEQFKNRSIDNFNNRCLHHHVFDFELLKEIYLHLGFKILDTSFAKPYHQIILGIKQ